MQGSFFYLIFTEQVKTSSPPVACLDKRLSFCAEQPQAIPEKVLSLKSFIKKYYESLSKADFIFAKKKTTTLHHKINYWKKSIYSLCVSSHVAT
jgi:hypothetical protein